MITFMQYCVLFHPLTRILKYIAICTCFICCSLEEKIIMDFKWNNNMKNFREMRESTRKLNVKKVVYEMSLRFKNVQIWIGWRFFDKNWFYKKTSLKIPAPPTAMFQVLIHQIFLLHISNVYIFSHSLHIL